MVQLLYNMNSRRYERKPIKGAVEQFKQIISVNKKFKIFILEKYLSISKLKKIPYINKVRTYTIT